MQERDDIKFECSNCSQSIEAPAELGGTETECPNCGAEITIPSVPPKISKAAQQKRKLPIWMICVTFICVALLSMYYFRYSIIMTAWRVIFAAQGVGGHARSTPRLSRVPITGAFGFSLGEKVPTEYEVKEGYCFVNDYANTPPFSTIQIACLSDRTIYTIIGYGYSNSQQVCDALELKYGKGGFDYTTNSSHFEWTNGTRTLDAECFGPDRGTIHVTYADTALRDQLFEEERNAAHTITTNLAPKL